MGDRTTVTLTIPKAFVARALPLFQEEINDKDDCDWAMRFTFWEVNYGELPCLDALEQQGIPYDSAWADGGDYTAGTQYCRFTEKGESQIITVYDNRINPDIHTLLSLIDKPKSLRQFILDHKNKTTPLPFDNQEEYSKRYLALQLIAA